MCSAPPKPYSKSNQTSQKTISSSLRQRFSRHPPQEKTQSFGSEDDSGASTESAESDVLRGISHYSIVDEVWHWSSADWGRQCECSPKQNFLDADRNFRDVCVGYNSLYNVDVQRLRHKHATGHSNASTDRPDGKRVWNWLLLCEDRKLHDLSMHQDLYPF